MPIVQELVNQDKYFHSVSGDKMIVNDIPYLSADGRDDVKFAIATVYSGDTMAITPSCDCGESDHMYMLNERCPSCGSIVRDPFDRIEPILWMRSLDNTPPFMNPHMWLMLRTVMATKFDFLRWVSDASYNPVGKIPPWVKRMSETIPGFTRTYKYLVDNLEMLLEYMAALPTYRQGSKKKALQAITKFYKENKADVYSEHIHLIHKRFIVVDKTNTGKYTDISLARAMDVVLSFMMVANKPNASDKQKGSVTGKVLSYISDLNRYLLSESVGKKEGIARKHVYGTRNNFTFRTVITSIGGPRRYDELQAPWAIAVTAYRPHMLNVLTRHFGMRPKEASALLYRSVTSYDETVARAMGKLIELAGGRLPVTFNRNPSLHQGSIVPLGITSFKKDPYDFTTSVSNLVVKLMNGDYDGDEINHSLSLDRYTEQLTAPLDPVFSVPDHYKYGSVGGLVALPKTTNTTIGNYLAQPVPDKLVVNLDIVPVTVNI